MSNSYLIYASNSEEQSHANTYCEKSLKGACERFERDFDNGEYAENCDLGGGGGGGPAQNFAVICFETGESKFYKVKTTLSQM